MSDIRNLLKISDERLEEINVLLTDPGNELVNQLLEVIEQFGGPREINRKAQQAAKLENLIARLQDAKSPYVADLNWLIEQRDNGAFISMPDYCGRVLGDKAKAADINHKNAVTLEVSAHRSFNARGRLAIADQGFPAR